ncbi:PIN domain-containing protein [Ensifer adhaerens]|jgi:predicted nucleic acid-binding protein|uniref:PIN domain-containing protein n=1 Tax=Ensifer adhaerens TaxID=106592 RepID=A0A9Q9DDI1_ENSAD|nr:PIN domain-containing protein [Ensifer adhaerens]USJ27624.1 PIN domain-containing protein [Ensifer adhaerens]
MTYSSSLNNGNGFLVLDTSVLINLHASQCGHEILAALPYSFIVPHIVAGELSHETSRRNGEQAFLDSLSISKNVSLVDLSDEEFEMFFELTSGSPSLDDGEAATIAISRARGLLPVIDERRGRGRAMEVLGREAAWSLDLLRHLDTIASLGEEQSTDALFLALRNGRMRIPPNSASQIIDIIGEDRARDCTCLPGYRKLFIGVKP